MKIVREWVLVLYPIVMLPILGWLWLGWWQNKLADEILGNLIFTGVVVWGYFGIISPPGPRKPPGKLY